MLLALLRIEAGVSKFVFTVIGNCHMMSKTIIIIPCYNEARRLPSERILSFLEQNADVCLCLVNDGSTDATQEVIEDLAARCSGQIDTLHLDRNSGKAEAVRQGMLKHMKDEAAQWIGYWDADLAAPLEEVNHLLRHADASVKLLMCCRLKRLGATVSRHVCRHILGRVMATFISRVLKLPVYDTQCGAKLIRREEIEHLFTEKFTTKWLFDVELIARMKKKYSSDTIEQCLFEVPLYKWEDVPGSKLKPRHMFFLLVEIVRIHWEYNIQGKTGN